MEFFFFVYNLFVLRSFMFLLHSIRIVYCILLKP